MAKRLRMTNADYLAIAVSPALIMLLVGSLVFFLLEVMYVGDYQARLNYVFALFVFATVLIARISIEMGSERAALYSVPLALAVFVVLQTFVEHPGVFSPLINILLIAVVWWCAHKLTWDCTLIDDDEDSSGEGLMQRVGLDDSDEPAAVAPQAGNELLSDEEHQPPLWKRLLEADTGPHMPGLWVLYFSLAALPLFGVGQLLIPAQDAGSRRYAFMLLMVYVAAALCLLVTTSFLGFRRYLRQRNVEMPPPMTVTWVAIGGTLIAIVMLLALILPRPAAEYAISQAPWRIQSPDDLSASRYGRGSDGAPGEEETAESVTSDEQHAPTAQAVDPDKQQSSASKSDHHGEDGSTEGPSRTSQSPDDPASGDPASGDPSSAEQPAESQPSDSGAPSEQGDHETTPSDQAPGDSESDSQNNESSESGEASQQSGTSQQTSQQPAEGQRSQQSDGQSQRPASHSMPEHSPRPAPMQAVEQAWRALGGIIGLLKLLFYLALAVLILFLAWKYRRELITALQDILRDLRQWLSQLFGGSAPNDETSEVIGASAAAPRKRFGEFRNPFKSGAARQNDPRDLVVYTFDAFQAWCADHSRPRSFDQTPQEFTRLATDADDPLHKPSRDLARLYSQLAYGNGNISQHDIARLPDLWQLMDSRRAPAPQR